MVKIYTDTNVLRYFGTAFADVSLAEDLQMQLLLPPLTLMELLSQLGTNSAEEALASVQALPRVHNPKHTGILPWPDRFFRSALFKLPLDEDIMTPALNNAVIKCLNAVLAADLFRDGEEMRALLDHGKNEAARNFSAVLEEWRSKGQLPEADHQAIFARSIAHRAGADDTAVDVDFIVSNLNAFYAFEKYRMEIGAKHDDYNVDKHSNDVYDAELLVYLADPTMHLLTSDKGFRRVETSTQAKRVHIADAGQLQNPKDATEVIRGIIGAASNAKEA